MKKQILSLFCIVTLLIACSGRTAENSMEASAASQKHVIIWSIKGNKLKYHKAYWASEYLNAQDWENIIGGGKRKAIKISPKATYYLLKAPAYDKLHKVSKEKFIKNLFDTSKYKENGKTWYWGMACKLTIKNGKVVKFVQEFQS